VAFAHVEQARLLLVRRYRRWTLTTLQASLHVADWSVARPRFAPGLSTTHGGSTTGDLGVSPDRTCTGWLSSASRSVTSCQPPCRHGARTAGRTPHECPHPWSAVSFGCRKRTGQSCQGRLCRGARHVGRRTLTARELNRWTQWNRTAGTGRPGCALSPLAANGDAPGAFRRFGGAASHCGASV